MKSIPQSYWRLTPSYFKVKLLDDFEERYIQWCIDDNYLGKENEFLQGEDIKSLLEVLHSWKRKPYLEVYQYPTEDMYRSMSVSTREALNRDADYFEKEDDNYVIPYHLFEVLS